MRDASDRRQAETRAQVGTWSRQMDGAQRPRYVTQGERAAIQSLSETSNMYESLVFILYCIEIVA